jgi:hypothetical protein
VNSVDLTPPFSDREGKEIVWRHLGGRLRREPSILDKAFKGELSMSKPVSLVNQSLEYTSPEALEKFQDIVRSLSPSKER